MTEFKGPIVEGAYYLRDDKWLVGPLTSDQARYYSTHPEAFTGRAWVTRTDPAEVVAELWEKCNAATEKRDEFEGVNTVTASWHGGHLTGFAEAANLVADKLGGGK